MYSKVKTILGHTTIDFGRKHRQISFFFFFFLVASLKNMPIRSLNRHLLAFVSQHVVLDSAFQRISSDKAGHFPK